MLTKRSEPSKQFTSASNVWGTDAAYDGLLELTPSPPLSSVLGEIKFGMKPLFESGSDRSESRYVEAW